MASTFAETWEGEVTGVPDCDRLVVRRGADELQVRIRGVDCPERGQEFFKICKRFATLLTHGQKVRVEDSDPASQGFVTARVALLVNGTDVGASLIRQGMAWWDRVGSPGDTAAEALERAARESYLGLWSEDSPQAPWEWRAQAATLAGPAPTAASPRDADVPAPTPEPQATAAEEIPVFLPTSR